MAFVPDLDTLESSSLNEETLYGPSCLCPQKKPWLDLEGTSPGVGIQVTVTKGPLSRTFRQAAVLVVAVTKLLKQPARKDFADSDLGSFLDDIFEPVSFQCIKGSYTKAPVFRYTRSQSFDILDIDHKCFVLESPTQLVALHLQGPSAGQKGESICSHPNVPVSKPWTTQEPPYNPRSTPLPVPSLCSEAQHCSVPSPVIAGCSRLWEGASGLGHQGLPALHVMCDEWHQARAAAGGEQGVPAVCPLWGWGLHSTFVLVQGKFWRELLIFNS
ncbi:interleukin-1 beta isoform X1 [Agelaius phoeniceus]|uniref:interleukin-1 beta isoform X1 n=1 Tax=Agelaius phoeniceus TaxID=39638 RepID=UPI004055132F